MQSVKQHPAKNRMVRILSQAGAAVVILAGCAVAMAKVNILGYWWENPLPYQQTPKGLKSIRAEDCGTCHVEIYKEWKASTHAQALNDLQFQAEMTKSPKTSWLCLNCHTPLLNQVETVAVDVRNRSTSEPVLQNNTRSDAVLRNEAVTCAVCHVKNGYIVGPYGNTNAPHPVKRDQKLLSSDSCATCHQATAAYTDTLVCSFETADEWRASPYAAKGQSCSSCHMPSVQRPLVEGGPVRASRRHFFGGGMIPKTQGLAATPNRSGLTVQVLATSVTGSNITVPVRLKNAYAGHKLPTGDPERHIRVDVSMIAGGKVAETRSIRIGQQWEWWPKARKVADTRLRPLEERVETLTFRAPKPGQARLRISVTNVRMTEQAAKFHHLLGRYPIEARVQSFDHPLSLRSGEQSGLK
jgi:hypothetical protein